MYLFTAAAPNGGVSVWTIVAVVVAVIGLLFGTGLIRKLLSNRRRVRIRVEHAATRGNDGSAVYGITVTVTNEGERGDHVEWIELSALDPPASANRDGIHWNTTSERTQVGHGLPARGAPVSVDLQINNAWARDGTRFTVSAKLSSRERVYKAADQRIDDGVVNVLHLP